MNGARPAGDMTTRVRGVKAESEDADAMVCVLLLPGASLTNRAGTGKATVARARGIGASEAGEVSPKMDHAARPLEPGAGAHLTSGISGERSESAACRG